MTPTAAHPIVPPAPGCNIDDLLMRALWVSGQVGRLHEISESLGVASHVCDVQSMGDVAMAQIIIEAADRLTRDLSEHLAAHIHSEQQPVLRIKQYRKDKKT